MKKNTTILKFIGPLLLMVVFASCETDERTTEALKWVNTHPHPIKVESHSINGFTSNYRCLFTDSCGQVFYAGEVEGFGPGTIK